MSAASAVSILKREALIGTAGGLVCALVWRYGFHIPSRNKIDNYYAELAAKEGRTMPFKRRTTLGSIADAPEGGRSNSTLNKPYSKSE